MESTCVYVDIAEEHDCCGRWVMGAGEGDGTSSGGHVSELDFAIRLLSIGGDEDHRHEEPPQPDQAVLFSRIFQHGDCTIPAFFQILLLWTQLGKSMKTKR